MKPKKKRKTKVTPGYLWLYGTAACVVAAVAIGAGWRQFSGPAELPEQSEQLPVSSEGSGEPGEAQSGSDLLEELPKITPWQTCDPDIEYSGEAYTVDNIADLKSANPWTEGAELATLPVYNNDIVSTIQFSEEVREKFGWPRLEGRLRDAEGMEALARSIADGLGVTVESVEVYPSEEAVKAAREKVEGIGEDFTEAHMPLTRVTLTCSGNISITAYSVWRATVQFMTPVPLPEEYNFDWYASYEDLTAAGEYLMGEYEGLLQMEHPVLNISGGDRKPEQEPHFDCIVYEGAGDLEQQLLSYQFNTISFSPDEEGNLQLIYVTRFELSDKLGDYPIYTPEEAQRKLAEGHYITAAPKEFSGDMTIERVELVYRGTEDITIMPYYRFFVPSFREESADSYAEKPNNSRIEKDYFTYYVPAVREEYIENMPVWNGGFR